MEEIIDRTIAPDIHDMGSLSLPEAESVVLHNGLTMHYLSGGNAEVSRIKLLMPGGIAESPRPKLPEIANALLLEGTASHSGEELSDIIEHNGAWTGVDTSTHHSALSMYCLNDTYSTLLPLVREIVMSPAFDPEVTSHIVRNEAARLEVEQRKVLYRAGCAMKDLVYGAEHPLSAVSSPDDLLELTPDMIASAHSRRLDPSGMHVYLSGLLSDRMIAETADMFSSIPPHEPYPLPPLKFPDHSSGERVHVDMPESLQSGVRMMIPAIGRNHPDYVPLRIATIALGGYFGSRLMLDIREEKGLTYGITASLLGYRHSGFISISSQTDPSTVDLLINETVAEIERMKDPGSYTEDEVNRISRFVLSELAGVLDTPFTRMDFLQTRVTASTPEGYFAMQDSAARSLTPDVLAAMAQKYFDIDKLFIATAGK